MAPTCNPFTCCLSCICNCILNLICQIVITIAVIVTIIGLVFWFLFHPNVPKFYVDDVSLTNFTLSPVNNTLFYNLAVNMTFRNPNRRLGIYYEKIEINAVYDGLSFSTEEINGFYLGSKKEKHVVNMVFKGEESGVDGGVRSRYDHDKNDGLFRIDLKLRMKMRFNAWFIKTPKFKPNFECDLKVPLGSKGVKFERSKCDFDW